MKYEEPEIRDYGEVLDMTRYSGAVGGEDDAGESIEVVIDTLAQAAVELSR